MGPLTVLEIPPSATLHTDAQLRKLRKENGRFFTPKEVAQATASLVFSNYADELLQNLQLVVRNGSATEVLDSLKMFLELKICDPMVGNGAFIVEAIQSLCAIRNKVTEFIRKNKVDITPSEGLQLLSDDPGSEKAYKRFVEKHSVYGVDLNADSLSLVRNLIGDNRSNEAAHFKQGNSLVGPTSPELNALSRIFRSEISELVICREILQDSPSRATKSAACSRIWRAKAKFLEWFHNRSSVARFQDLAPFVWEVEFPEVFFEKSGAPINKPGFDFVLGNPPWEVIKPNDREFFSTFYPGFFGKPRIERDKIRSFLLGRPEVASEYAKYLEKIRLTADYFKRSGHYQYQSEKGIPSPNINLYKLGCEQFYRIARFGGRVAILTPLGLATDAGTKGLRRMLFEKTALDGIWGFVPPTRLFLDVDQSLAICTFKKGERTGRFRFVSKLLGPKEIALYQSDASIVIDPGFVKKTSPLTWSIPSVRDRRDLSILDKMYKFPTLGTLQNGSWNVTITRELDETNDRHMFRAFDTGVPLLKGKDVFPFTVGNPTIWVDQEAYRPMSDDNRASRVVWRDIARPNLRRRCFAALAPKGYALGNSLNYITTDENESTKHFLIAILNSLLVDYRIRQITSNSHINQFIVSQLPVPRLSSDSNSFSRISHLSKSLSTARMHGALWDQLECELNAAVARMYGLALDELEYVIRSYTWLSPSDRTQVLKSYRTL